MANYHFYKLYVDVDKVASGGLEGGLYVDCLLQIAHEISQRLVRNRWLLQSESISGPCIDPADEAKVKNGQGLVEDFFWQRYVYNQHRCCHAVPVQPNVR